MTSTLGRLVALAELPRGRVVLALGLGVLALGFGAALPDGYATVVGDGARALSPGERRRIGLARAFLRDAPLVILDEPTADLDAQSVAVVAAAVRRLQTGRTVLLIAHRAELVRNADRVVHLVDGVAVAEPARTVA